MPWCNSTAGYSLENPQDTPLFGMQHARTQCDCGVIRWATRLMIPLCQVRAKLLKASKQAINKNKCSLQMNDWTL